MNKCSKSPQTARSRSFSRTIVLFCVAAVMAVLPVIAWAGVSIGVQFDHHGHVAYSVGISSGHHHSAHLGYHHGYRPYRHGYAAYHHYYRPIRPYRHHHLGHYPAYRHYQAPHRVHRATRPYHRPKPYSRHNY